MKRCLIIGCGGTIAMDVAPNGSLLPSLTIDQVVGHVPAMSSCLDFETTEFGQIDSTDMNPHHWEELVELISKRFNQFDGFIIVMGTNTLGYLSSALSFALAYANKPVVITGAQIPIIRPWSDGRLNLLNSARIIELLSRGVWVVFGTKIIRGCRAKKRRNLPLNPFESFHAKEFGEIEIDVRFHEPIPPPPPANSIAIQNGFCADICSLTISPGIHPKTIYSLLDCGVRGLVIRGFGNGDIPSQLHQSLKEAFSRAVPVVVTTQCADGVTDMVINDVGRLALETGVVQAFDMSIEAMTTKLAWLLAQNITFDQLRASMETNLVGEIGGKD